MAFVDNAKLVAVQGVRNPWILAWLIAGVITIIIPTSIWSSHRNSYYNLVGYANQQQYYYEQKQQYYEQQQQYYEEQQNGNNGNNGNNNNQNYYGYQYKECAWFQWGCLKQQYKYAMMAEGGGGGGNNGNGEYTETLPTWYLAFGGEDSEEMRRWKEENTGVRQEEGGNNFEGGVKFAYASTIILFVSFLAYGTFSLYKRSTDPCSSGCSLIAVLVAVAAVAMMNLTLATGAISSDDRDLEDSWYGWYGQWAVLMIYTHFWIMLFCVAFIVVFTVQHYLETKKIKEEEHLVGNEYHAPDVKNEANIQMTSPL